MLNKKTKPIMALAFGAIFALSGALNNLAHAADLSVEQKDQLERAYLQNSISNKAGKMLLEKVPQTTAAIKDDLTLLVNESDAILVKTKPVYDGLYPERANESEEVKELDGAYFANKVNQEAVFLLLGRAPETVEAITDSLTSELNKSISATSRAEVELNKLRGLKQLTIVHVNDTHGRVVENNKSQEIGYAKLKTFFDYKNVKNNAILLDAGDTFHGTTFATISYGDSMVDTMNLMGYTAHTAGNHDFNYGTPRLVELANKANFAVLGSNVVNDNGQAILNQGQVVDIDGVKVGIFGLATEETKTKSAPANTEGVTFLNSVETAKREVATLKAKGAEIIICLSHLGDNPASKETSVKVAEAVEGIDLIVDGHSHTKLAEGKLVGNVLLAQAWEHGKEIGEITLLVDKDNKLVSKKAILHPYARNQFLAANETVLAKIDEIKAKNDEVLQVKVGETSVNLDGERQDVRTGETNLGNFVTDAMIKVTGADVALTNGGGIRASIKEGEILRNDVLTVFPFTNFAVTIDVTGAEIKAALEHGLTDYPEQAGKFPHISGMTVRFDSNKAAGERVTEVTVNGAPLDLNKTYNMVTNDFLTTGGDGYEMLKKPRTGEYELVSEIFENAIKEAGTISPETDGRIEEINENPAVAQPAA